MADANAFDTSSRQPTPRPITPIRSRRWLGFPAATPRPIGRDQELSTLRELLLAPRRRLVTVTGPGGVGKTRLALAVAEEISPEFSDGAAFIPLATISEPALILPAIARVLDVREAPGRSPRDTLAAVLRDLHLLLILDNFEHLATAEAAADISALLEACPAVTILVTSRTPLRLHDEHLFAAAPLSLPLDTTDTSPATLTRYGAVALFIERARMTRPDFALTTGNAASIVEICHRLDGLPLAIELAAAWVRVLPPADLLARLEPRMPLLRGGAADQPPRLRTMRDAIAWSYDRLSDEERQCLRRLAILVGGFTLEAAEWVTGSWGDRAKDRLAESRHSPSPNHPITSSPSPATLDILASLLDQSLLFQSAVETSEPRFEMLETIREFAQEQLTTSGESAEIAARHAAWCVRLAEEVWRSGRLSQRGGLAVLEVEHPNFRAALTWFLARGETSAALHLAGGLAEFWMRHAHMAEGQTWLERTLAADDGAPTVARAEALVGLSMLLWHRNDFAQAARLLDEAESAARAAGDAGVVAYVRLHQGYIAVFRGDPDAAVTRGEESLATCPTIPQGFNCHGALWLLASATLMRGENERAAELYERLLASARTGGDEVSLGNALYGLAVLAERRGELARALAGFAEAATVCLGFGDRWAASHGLEGVATVAAALGHAEPSVRLFAAVRALRAAVGATQTSVVAVERQSRELALAQARDALGEQRFSAAWVAGSELSIEEAIAEAVAPARNVTQSTPPARALGLAGLSARERQVLPLLIEGRSDRQIAEALFISQRTASDHVGAILRKLGVGTRAEAAARAVRDEIA